MQTPAGEPQRSGSRWEPAAEEQVTDVLIPPPAAPVAEPVAELSPASGRRGISTAAAVLIAVLVGGLGGAVAGFAIAGGGDPQPVSTVDGGQQVQGGTGQTTDDEGEFEGPRHGHHGFDDHEGDD